MMWQFTGVALALVLACAPRLASGDTTGLRRLFVGDAAAFSSATASGAPEGYAVTLCERIAAAVRPGTSPSWQETTIADGLDQLSRGEADLLCGPVSATVAREKNVEFSSPIAIGGIGAVLRPDAPPWLLRLLRIGDTEPVLPRTLLAQLQWPRRIAVLRGGTASDWLETLLAHAEGDVVLVPVANYGEATRLFIDGDVGAWVGEWAVLLQRVRSDTRLAGMTLTPRPIVGEPLAIAMRPENTQHRAVQAALSRIIRGPDFGTLTEHWFGQAGRTQAPLVQSVTPRSEPLP